MFQSIKNYLFCKAFFLKITIVFLCGSIFIWTFFGRVGTFKYEWFHCIEKTWRISSVEAIIRAYTGENLRSARHPNRMGSVRTNLINCNDSCCIHCDFFLMFQQIWTMNLINRNDSSCLHCDFFHIFQQIWTNVV